MLDIEKEVARLETFISSPSQSHSLVSVVLTRRAAENKLTPLSTQISRLGSNFTDKTLLYWTTRIGRLELDFPLASSQPRLSQKAWREINQHYRHQVEQLYEKVTWQSGVQITLVGLFTIAATRECFIWHSGRRIEAYTID